MNPSRENQEITPEAKAAKTSRAEAFDKWLCWNPEHTAREREIVAHMTAEEGREFQQLSWRGGALFGVVLGGGMSIFLLLPEYVDVGIIGRTVAIALYLSVACFVVLRVKRAARRFLWSTAWAQAQGWE